MTNIVIRESYENPGQFAFSFTNRIDAQTAEETCKKYAKEKNILILVHQILYANILYVVVTGRLEEKHVTNIRLLLEESGGEQTRMVFQVPFMLFEAEEKKHKGKSTQ